jgi:hypothetical protein
MVYEYPRSKSARRRNRTVGWVWLVVAIVGAAAAGAWFVLRHGSI